MTYPSASIRCLTNGMSPALRDLSRESALTPSTCRMTSLRPISDFGEHRQMVGGADASGPRAMLVGHRSSDVDRVELLRGPVRTPQPMRELRETRLVRRGPDAAPQLEPWRS